MDKTGEMDGCPAVKSEGELPTSGWFKLGGRLLPLRAPIRGASSTKKPPAPGSATWWPPRTSRRPLGTSQAPGTPLTPPGRRGCGVQLPTHPTRHHGEGTAEGFLRVLLKKGVILTFF